MSDPYSLTLAEKIDPAHTALVVIDYQNDYMAEGGAFERTGSDVGMMQAIEPALAAIIAAARGAGVLVIFVKSVYSTPDNRFLSRAFLHQARRARGGLYHEVPALQPDGWGGEFYGRVRPEPGERVVVKHRFSAFVDTELPLLLRSKAVQTIVATGVATQTCVESTVRDAFFRDYFCVVPQECVAAYRADWHDDALERIDRLFGEVVALKGVVDVWATASLASPTSRVSA